MTRQDIMDVFGIKQMVVDPTPLETDEEILSFIRSCLSLTKVFNTAHWIYDPNAHDWNLGGWTCSRCRYVGGDIPTHIKRREKPDITYKDINPYIFKGSRYCAGCGAKMEPEEEVNV